MDDLCDMAHELDRTAHATLVDTLGERHPLTMVVATNLASDLAALGRHTDALDLGARTLALSTAVLGEAHPSTLSLAANQALDLTALGRAEEGERLHDRILGEMRERLGPDHPATTALGEGERANCFIDPLPL
ncbi:tetratricopeptide repeat protein [Streptomyces sp. S6]